MTMMFNEINERLSRCMHYAIMPEVDVGIQLNENCVIERFIFA